MMRALAAAALSLWGACAQAAVDIQEVTSPGGIEAWLVEEHSIPFTALEIPSGAGANLDREGERGQRQPDDGAPRGRGRGDMDARAFQTAREGLAASFGSTAGDDTVSTSASMPFREPRRRRWTCSRQALVSRASTRTRSSGCAGRVASNIARTRRTPAPSPARPSWPRPSRAPLRQLAQRHARSVAGLTREDLVQAHGHAGAGPRLRGRGGRHPPRSWGLSTSCWAAPREAGPRRPPDVPLPGGVTVVDYPTPQAVRSSGTRGSSGTTPTTSRPTS
jgi:zinc protease